MLVLLLLFLFFFLPLKLQRIPPQKPKRAGGGLGGRAQRLPPICSPVPQPQKAASKLPSQRPAPPRECLGTRPQQPQKAEERCEGATSVKVTQSGSALSSRALSPSGNLWQSADWRRKPKAPTLLEAVLQWKPMSSGGPYHPPVWRCHTTLNTFGLGA